MINNNHLDNDDVFLGSTFLSFQMAFAENLKYIVPLFIIVGVMCLFLRCSNLWRIAIIGKSLLGFLCYSFSYSAIRPCEPTYDC